MYDEEIFIVLDKKVFLSQSIRFVLCDYPTKKKFIPLLATREVVSN